MWDADTADSPNRSMTERLRYPAVAVLVVLVVVRVLPVLGSTEAFPILSGFLAIAFAVWLGWRWVGPREHGRVTLLASARWWTLWVVVALAWVGLAAAVHVFRPAMLAVPGVVVLALVGAVLGVRAHDREVEERLEREGRAG